ncbi:hypothetical protein H5410_055934 [Solanum commersonii]|uniref:Uncharacterized protein n=1 Tax=Solanum commersonii TaxID=4109 RepID=A0A9J5WL96_SOLCO|nr:hypothetical protein H5410_055934 [Solanum commersonii]
MVESGISTVESGTMVAEFSTTVVKFSTSVLLMRIKRNQSRRCLFTGSPSAVRIRIGKFIIAIASYSNCTTMAFGLYLHAATETKLVVDTSRGETLRINQFHVQFSVLMPWISVESNILTLYMAYIMDTNEEEIVKGITVEVGRAPFGIETTILQFLMPR